MSGYKVKLKFLERKLGTVTFTRRVDCCTVTATLFKDVSCFEVT